MLTFLAVTDLHYSDKPNTGGRYHSLSISKLRDALAVENKSCDFVMNFGDMVDALPGFKPQAELLREVLDEYEKASVPVHTAIGNQDMEMPKREFIALCEMNFRYYAFACGEYNCVVLDASVNDTKNPFTEGSIDRTKCYIDDEQKQWLARYIEKSRRKILVFCHMPLRLSDTEDDSHLVVNSKEICDILEENSIVRAVFSGHYHNGDYTKHGGVHYITFASMSDGEDTAFARVFVSSEGVRVEGHGRQKSFSTEANTKQRKKLGWFFGKRKKMCDLYNNGRYSQSKLSKK